MNSDRYCLLVSSEHSPADQVSSLLPLLEGVLQEHKLRLAHACEASQALAHINRRMPIIVVSVVATADDPYWLSHLVERVQQVPVIALAAEQQPLDVIGALRQGASDFFAFPIADTDAFARALRRQVEKAKLMADSEYLRDELQHSLALLREDQQAGRHVQQKMLPPNEQVINDYRFEYSIKPSLFLSGDFVDYFRISESLSMFYLADISGHGASSAFVTVLLKNMTNRLLRNYNRGSSFHILSPTDVLSRINKELLDTGLGKHLTMFVGLLDRIENTLQYGAGGHFPMPILFQNGKAEYLPGTGMPVGLFDDAQFEGRIVELEEQFQLTLFSDGVLEILDRPDLKSKENFLLEVAQQGYDNLQDVAKHLGIDQIEDAPDDIAALNVSRVV